MVAGVRHGRPRESSPSSEGEADGILSIAERIEQARERSQLGVALAGSAEVAEHARHVLEVVAFAVAVAKACKDAEHLELALRAHPFVIAVEIVKVGVHRQASLAGSFPVADHIVQFLVLGPLDIGVAIEVALQYINCVYRSKPPIELLKQLTDI